MNKKPKDLEATNEKKLLVLRPWFFQGLIFPMACLIGIIVGLLRMTLMGSFVCTLGLMFFLWFWEHSYLFFKEGIVVKRFLFSDRVYLSSAMDKIKETELNVGNKMSYGPLLIMKNGKFCKISCGIAWDQNRLIRRISDMYHLDIDWLTKESE